MKSSIIRSAIVVALLQSMACADTKSSSNSPEHGIWYTYYGEPLTIELPSGQIVFEVHGRSKASVDLVDILIDGQVWKSYKARSLSSRDRERTFRGDWQGHEIYVRCKLELPPDDSYEFRTTTSCYFRLDGKNAGEIIPSIAPKRESSHMNSTDFSREQVVSVVTAQFTKVWSRGDVDLIPQIYADDFVGYFPGGVIHGHDGIRNVVLAHRKAFPDWLEKIEDVIFEGDKLAVRFTSTGTNLGPNVGKPPTNRSVKISEIAIYRMAGGKIAEQWVNPDTHSLLQQLYGDQDQTGP